MRWSRALFGLLFLIAACAVRTPLPNVEPASSVHLSSRNISCTAIHIGDGLVLTAGHCVIETPISIDGHFSMIQWVNNRYDVALLLVPGLSREPSSALACRDPRVGEAAMMIGDTTIQRNIYAFGKVATRVYAHLSRPAVVLFDMRGGPGNSGAPIYDAAGNVFAVVIAVVPALGNMIVAVPGSALCKLIASKGTISLKSSLS